MKPLGIDDEQDGYIAKLGKVTYGVVQHSTTIRGSRPEIQDGTGGKTEEEEKR